MDISNVQSAVLSIISVFISRQSIAYDAMSSLRPDILLASNKNARIEDIIDLSSRYINAPEQGLWENWSYHFHGSGCRLIHTKTGEPIEWDAPDVLTFDAFWLLDYINWRREFQADDTNIINLELERAKHGVELKDVVFDSIEDMLVSGILINTHSENTNKLAINPNYQVNK